MNLITRIQHYPSDPRFKVRQLSQQRFFLATEMKTQPSDATPDEEMYKRNLSIPTSGLAICKSVFGKNICLKAKKEKKQETRPDTRHKMRLVRVWK